MATGGNRKRNKKQKGADIDRSPWGLLFQNKEEEHNSLHRTPFSRIHDDAYDEEIDDRELPFLQRLWKSFSIWSSIAVVIFLSFTVSLFILLVRMWNPQDLSDIAGYQDSGRARDLESLIINANGAPVTLTEAELNRYLRDTCRMRQTGIFSIIASGQGVAVRVHDGYAELVLDRVLGSNIHQTTSVNLSFRQENKLGRTELCVDFKGGAPIAGCMPRGGSIGSIGIPQRHIRMLKPALETLISCYPRIAETIERYQYCPLFSEGKNGADSRIHLVPHTPENAPLQ